MKLLENQRRSGIGIGIGALAIIVVVTSGLPANATTTDSVATGDVDKAISRVQKTNGSLIQQSAKSITDSDSAAVVSKGGVTIDVPKKATDGITIAGKNTPTITIGLPNAAQASQAKRLKDGTVVYPAAKDSFANSVIPSDKGVQMLTTIAGERAPESYRYAVSVPRGGRITLASNGGAVVLDRTDHAVATVKTPWAKDANGKTVKTHFTTDGKSLTQVVEHRGAKIAYPVVADPWIETHWWGFNLMLNRTDTAALAAGTVATITWVYPPAAILFAVGGVYYAQSARAQGICLGYAYPWGSIRGWLFFRRC